MQSLTDDDEDSDSSGGPRAAGSQQPGWMRTLYANVQNWQQMLPASVPELPRTTESIKNPLFRVFDRENQIGRALLATIQKDLADLTLVCEGQLKQTNHLRMLMNCFTKGLIPNHWRRYTVSKHATLTQWIADLNVRLQQVARIAENGENELTSGQIWLGGLFIPEAFVTATRQVVAQRNGWSLEELQMELDLEQVDSSNANAFAISGLSIEGARWHEGGIQLSNDPATKLGPSQIRWVRKSDATPPTATTVVLPVYLNSDRHELLFSLRLPAPTTERASVAQRGISLVAWS
jgi:dynein heavy chain 1